MQFLLKTVVILITLVCRSHTICWHVHPVLQCCSAHHYLYVSNHPSFSCHPCECYYTKCNSPPSFWSHNDRSQVTHMWCMLYLSSWSHSSARCSQQLLTMCSLCHIYRITQALCTSVFVLNIYFLHHIYLNTFNVHFSHELSMCCLLPNVETVRSQVLQCEVCAAKI